jgi:hypothetical protein
LISRLAAVIESLSNSALRDNIIGKDQCKKLQKFIMNLETAEKLDELLELTIA